MLGLLTGFTGWKWCNNADSCMSKKMKKLRRSKISSYEDIATLQQETSELIWNYEGCDTDLDDLRTMQKVITVFFSVMLLLRHDH